MARPNRVRWLLAVLQAAGPAGLTPVQLQKCLFVLGERSRSDLGEFYRFEPYHYGPFDSDVYDDADALAQEGLVEIDASRGRSQRTYRLTEAGIVVADAERAKAPRGAVEFAGRVVRWSQKLTFAEIVRSVYEAFPEMRRNSVFQDYPGG